MKAEKYILKNIFVEKSKEKEYEYHVQRIKQVKPQIKLRKDEDNIKENLIRLTAQHIAAKRFKEKRKIEEQQANNKIMIKKLLQISEGKHSIKNYQNSLLYVPSKIIQKRAFSPSFITESINTTNVYMDNSIKQQQQLSNIKLIKKEPNIGESMNKSIRVRSFSHQTLMSNNLLPQKKEMERIQYENTILAKKLISLPSIIKSTKEMSIDFKDQRSISCRISKSRIDKVNKQELCRKAKISVSIQIVDINFLNTFPNSRKNEFYFYEVQICSRAPKRTSSMNYNIFSKLQLNEKVRVNEVNRNNIIYIKLYQVSNQEEKYLCDFKLNLQYYLYKNETIQIQQDLYNWKQLEDMDISTKKLPEYRGWIKYDLTIQNPNNIEILKDVQLEQEEQEEQIKNNSSENN